MGREACRVRSRFVDLKADRASHQNQAQHLNLGHQLVRFDQTLLSRNRNYLGCFACGTLFQTKNEDLPRSTDDKTSTVHFLRFEFTHFH